MHSFIHGDLLYCKYSRYIMLIDNAINIVDFNNFIICCDIKFPSSTINSLCAFYVSKKIVMILTPVNFTNKASVNTLLPQDSITLQGVHALNSSILNNPLFQFIREIQMSLKLFVNLTHQHFVATEVLYQQFVDSVGWRRLALDGISLIAMLH